MAVQPDWITLAQVPDAVAVGQGLEPFETQFVPLNEEATGKAEAYVEGLAVDATYLYWTDLDNNCIGRARLDGSEVLPDWLPAATIQNAGEDSPMGLVIQGEHLYWTMFRHSKSTENYIGRCKLDGSEVVKELVADAGSAYLLTANATYLFWDDNQGAKKGFMGRAKLDGTEPLKEWINTTATSGTNGEGGLVAVGEYLYFSHEESGEKGYIGRVKQDGTELEPTWLLLGEGTEAFGGARFGVWFLTYDGTYLIWTNAFNFEPTRRWISRVKLDGTELQNGWLTAPEGPEASDTECITAGTNGHLYYYSSSGPNAIGRYSYGEAAPAPVDCIYWSSTRGIGRAAIDGSGAVPNRVPIPQPGGAPLNGGGATSVLVDGSHVYCHASRILEPGSKATAEEGWLRALLDGTGLDLAWLTAPEERESEEEAVHGLGAPGCLTATHIYWIEINTATVAPHMHIGRAKIDGSEREPHWLEIPESDLQQVATDGTFLYFTDSKVNWAIGRVKLDGTELDREWLPFPEEASVPRPRGLACDATYIYWSDGEFVEVHPARIGRARLDRAGRIEPTWVALPAETVPGGITVDATFLYFANSKPGVGRLPLTEPPEPEPEPPPEPEPDPPPVHGSYIESIRERPPLRLNVQVQTPDGQSFRWGLDDPAPSNAPVDLSFSSVMPGGFERLSCVLERDTRLVYPDLAELSTITVRGAGGDVAWQGRLEKTPDTGGFQEQVQPEAVGWQAHLEDDNTAREIWVDRVMSNWAEMALARKIENVSTMAIMSPSTVGGSGAVETALTGAWSVPALCEAWYNAHGISIGRVFAYWDRAGGVINPADSDWDWELSLSPVETGTGTVRSGNLRAAGPSGVAIERAGEADLFFAILSLFYTAPAGGDGVLYPIDWTTAAVYGTHGLPLYGTDGPTDAKGVLSSDVLANALLRWAPKIAFTVGPEGTIRPSSWVIEQLAFLEPTNVAEMLKQATRFELSDWAIWEGPAFYLNPRGERGRHWRARVGPAQLQQTGPQVARLWNGVTVSYTDVAGQQRTVGPPGSGAEATDPSLVDEDPENPLNETGIRKWAPLKMGTSTRAGAIQVGAIFLREQAQLETSGQATIVGYVEDESGVLYPAWAIRGGDTIAFVDAWDPSARRVVHAGYDEPSRSAQVQLDQPPDSLTAILERLSVSIQPLGFS